MTVHNSIKPLLDFLEQYGGSIVCTASLQPEWIEQARASGRMYVNEYSIGFVWQPDIDKFPENEKEVEWLERWYPLPVELPDELKDPTKIIQRAEIEKMIRKQKRNN